MSAAASPFVDDSLHVATVSDGFHCTDDSMYAGQVDASIANVQETVLSSMSTWLGNWTADWNANATDDPNSGSGSDSGRNAALPGHSRSVVAYVMSVSLFATWMIL